MATLRSGKIVVPNSNFKKIRKHTSRAAPSLAADLTPAAGRTGSSSASTAGRTPAAAGRTPAAAGRTPELGGSSAAAAEPTVHQEYLEEEELNKLLGVFRMKYLAEVVKRAVSIHPDLIDRVRELADVEPGLRNIVVTGINVYTKPDTLVSFFRQYGEIDKCTTNISYSFLDQPKLIAFILFKDRHGAREALRNPRKDIDGAMARCLLYSLFENNIDDEEYPMEESEEEEEEEPIEKLIDRFENSNLVVIVKEAVAKYPDFVLRVLEVADVDPEFRLIVVDNLMCSTSNKHFSTLATKLYSVFGLYGEIQHCTYHPGRAYILFKHRRAATEALKQPFKEVGHDSVICKVMPNLPCTPTHLKVGTPVGTPVAGARRC